MPRCDRASPAASSATMPADPCPRCCRLYRPRYARRAASGTPVPPMMPHMSPSVSHATGYRAEIYVAQPLDTVRHLPVAQPDTHAPATLAHRARAVRRHVEFPGERGDGVPVLGVAGDHRAAVRLAEQDLHGRKPKAVSRKVDVE